ncbi:hypothetical protein M9Y10_008560 [Tritrichomonas musculus]|uniref:Serine/threonine-protein phosphatase n=1 Tax=Tritrichomonas musculus TaxID=1915356 RepID=A0ABR2IYE5_9EUKA
MSSDPQSQLLNSYQDIFNFYFQVIQNLNMADPYGSGQSNLVFPIIPINILVQLNQTVSQIFSKEPYLLNICCDVNVVGDLHGHIFDLFRILRTIGFPPDKNYLFLGDFVDRGEFSLETITFIFILKVLFPKNIFIIRGNHEFADMYSRCGFSNELENVYNNPIVSVSFNAAFAEMPLAALVNDSTLCLHGGIGPEFSTLGQINDIKRPLFGYDNALVSSLVWSDPSPQVATFAPSARGLGYLFGSASLNCFLKSQALYLIVRGHECVKNGIEFALDSKIVTVFSASNYCGMLGNKSGVLVLKEDGTHEAFTFPALPYIKRFQAFFIKSEDEFSFKVSNDILSKIAEPKVPRSLPMLNPAKPDFRNNGRVNIGQSGSSSHIPTFPGQVNEISSHMSRQGGGMVRMKPINILGKSMSSRTPASSLRNDDLILRSTSFNRAISSIKQVPVSSSVKVSNFADIQVSPHRQD